MSQYQTLALTKEVEHRSLTTLRNKLIKIGAKVARHGRYIMFQLVNVAIPRAVLAETRAAAARRPRRRARR